MSASVDEVLNASIDEVWSIVGNFADLRRWHPLVARVETHGEGVGAVRTVHFAEWWAKERLDRWDAAAHVVGYSVVDGSRPETIGVKGTIALDPRGPHHTRLRWVSGLEDSNPQASMVNAGLAAYYPMRIGHLRQALGLG